MPSASIEGVTAATTWDHDCASSACRCTWVRFDSGKKMLPFDKTRCSSRVADRPSAHRAACTSATLSPRSCATTTAASAPMISER